MKAIVAFLLSAILAVIAAIGLLIKLIPPGEGAFGIAKAVPLNLTILIPAFIVSSNGQVYNNRQI